MRTRKFAEPTAHKGMHMKASLKRRRGRPWKSERGPGVRAMLTAAARRLFAEKGFDAVGIRDVADEAGVSLAMIRYYFSDKRGLYAAMFEEAFGGLRPRLESAVAEAARKRRDPIEAIIDVFGGMLAEHPWIPQLMIREVLSGGGTLREEFIDVYSTQISRFLFDFFESLSRRRLMRKNIDPRLMTVSFISLVIYPAVARPILERILPPSLTRRWKKLYPKHVLQLIRNGIKERRREE